MSTYSQLIINDGPVAYYRLDESSGTSAHDSSGNGYNGTYSGSGVTYAQPGAISGDSDTCVLLNGSTGRVTTPGGASPVGWASVTLEAWVNLSSNSFGSKATIWATGTTPSTADGIKFWIGANGTNGGFAVGITGNRWAQATFSQTFSAGTWYHVAGVWDGSAVTVYVNGVANGTSGTVSGNTIDDTGSNLALGRDPQLPGDYFPGSLDEAAVYSTDLSPSRIQAHYAAGIAQVLTPITLVTAPPGPVFLTIDDVWYPTILEETINIDRTATDPIPTFTFTLQDDPSQIALTELSEVLFIDTGQIPNPAHNLLLNPAINPYTTSWSYTGHAGVTAATAGGGGLLLTFSNAGSGSSVTLAQTSLPGGVTPGQNYMASVTVQGGSSPTNVYASLIVNVLDPAQNQLASFSSVGPTPPSTTATVYSLAVLAPPNAAFLQVQCVATTTSSTNSGAITFSQAQLEPMVFTAGAHALTYPTPWCASGQTNCLVLPDGTSIRQLRLFGGIVTKATAGAHVGPNRQWQVTVSGYAWLLQKQLLNDSWTTTADSSILSAIVTKYFPTTFSTGQVLSNSGIALTLSYTYNGTARDAFDAAASASNYLLYVDAYRTIWYQPAGYNTLPFQLSDTPDELTSFEYYNYTRDLDATQLGNAIYVSGSQGVAATVFDAASIGYYGQILNNQGIFWRSVSDSSLGDNNSAIQRGIGEAMQYNYARPIIHLTTNQFMIPGYTVLFTSRTDGFVQQVFLVQKATLVLTGFKALGLAIYEFQCDLGAFNPDLSHVISKIMRRDVTLAAQQTTQSYYGPVSAPTPAIDVIASDRLGWRESVQVTVTSTTPIAGTPKTWYGTAGAVYGSNLVGYG